MEPAKIKVGVLTSSRADYGIYYPLLNQLTQDSVFDLSIIVFGTHLSVKHGETINQIISDGFNKLIKVETIVDGDQPKDISASMGKTLVNFSTVWNENKFDVVFALGDRYEMFAACASLVPFSIPLAHIHGGETTLGAIDDVFRHCITQMATYHFTTTEVYKKRVIEIKGSEKNVYNVGALSIDNLKSIKLLSTDDFNGKFGIDLTIPSILITFHPETVDFEKNKEFVRELINAFKELGDFQLIITMPNSDTMGDLVRKELNTFIESTSNAIGIESFGILGYLSCMKHCEMMLGNTSSGYTEALFFSKPVINLGDRQKGRIITENIFNCKIEKNEILNAVKKVKTRKQKKIMNIYGDGSAASKIVSILKSKYVEKL